MDISVLQKEIGLVSKEISEHQAEQFAEFGDLLLARNEQINLTRITEPAAVCRQHFLDSIMPVRSIPIDGKSLIDIGTGAGFPGIPLKIMAPDLKLTLLDALDKRCRFLQEVVDRLGLTDVTILHGRAEDVARDDSYRGQFDLATSRAVAKLNILCEYALPFLKVDGQFIAYKLEEGVTELAESENAFRLLGAACDQHETYHLPEVEPARALFIITKKTQTSEKYPRRAGIPGKKPL